MRLFWVKMIQEIIFLQTRMFGYHGKWYFSENDFRLTNIFTFDPEMIFHPHFHFKSFPEKEREREERAQIREREREERAQIAPLVRQSHHADERRDRRSQSMRSHGAIVDRAARSTSALIRRTLLVAPTSPPLDVAFTARSHLLLRRIWFIFFCCVLFLLSNLMHFL